MEYDWESAYRILVLQRRVKAEDRMVPSGRLHGVSHGSVWPVRCAAGHLPAIAAAPEVRTVPGAASPALLGTPVAA